MEHRIFIVGLAIFLISSSYLWDHLSILYEGKFGQMYGHGEVNFVTPETPDGLYVGELRWMPKGYRGPRVVQLSPNRNGALMGYSATPWKNCQRVLAWTDETGVHTIMKI